ncbi:MAG: exosortase system-associated protein, TIGR04073 family [Candidatus Binatia bacterium]
MLPSSRVPKAAIAALAAIALPIVLSTSTAAAQEQSAARKLGRGAAGVGLGVLEIPGNMYQTGSTDGALAGATLGLGLGVGKFVARELVGIYELFSAPFAVPAGFQPILAPEFPWEYFDRPEGQAYGFTDPYLADQAAEIGALTGAVITRRGSVLVVEFPKRVPFVTGSAALSMDAQTRLAELATILERYPSTTITVHGYTDNTGDSAYNLKLSNQRAKAVGGYLVSRGVASSRVVNSGRGEADPIADNATVAGRERNRRVEIEIRSIPKEKEKTLVGGARPH